MVLADVFGADSSVACISYCLDCATSSFDDTLCSDEQRANGAKLSQHTAITLDSLDIYSTTYANYGFKSCETDDCNMADACSANSTVQPISLDGNSTNYALNETSSLAPLTRCWAKSGSSGDAGYSMVLADVFGADSSVACISYCLDCATSSFDDTLCSDEQRANGAKLSQHTAITLDSLDIYSTTYANYGFKSCEADDCNMADACSGGSNITTGTSNATAIPTFPSASFAPTPQSFVDGNMVTSQAPAQSSVAPISAPFDKLPSQYEMSYFMKNPATLSRYGFSVAISADGNVIAVGDKDATNSLGGATGAVYLYSLVDNFGSNSMSLLQVLNGQSVGDEFGNSLALSQDGKRLVVGARSENSKAGAMRIYHADDAGTEGALVNANAMSWSLKGIIPGQNSDRAGWTVSISQDGNVIAMGSPRGGAQGGGSVLAFRYNETSSGWDSYGSVTEGSMTDAEGYSISLSGTGSTMVVGNPRSANLAGESNAGKAVVYYTDGSGWNMLGQEMYGEAVAALSGTSVAMSQDGSIVVIGGIGRSETDSFVTRQSVGECRIFQLQLNEWKPQHAILGKTSEERLGSSVAISSDGNTVACGGSYATDLDSKKSGVVRLWDRITLQESELWPRLEEGDDIEGATFGASVSVSSDGDYVVVGAPNWKGPFPGTIQLFKDVS